MGLFFNSAPQVLHPVNPPVGVLANYIMQQPTTLVLKEKVFSFSGDDFSIKDTNGVTVVQCAGKALSFRDTKRITDASGRPLFVLKNKLISIHKTFLAEDPNGREIFRVKKHLSFGTKMSAVFTSATTGKQTELSIKGDMFGMGANIMMNDSIPVATISRQYMNIRQVWGDQQTYYVTVAAGVDLALIAAICICFDEAKNESN